MFCIVLYCIVLHCIVLYACMYVNDIHNLYLLAIAGSSISSFDVFKPGVVSYACWAHFPSSDFWVSISGSLRSGCDRGQDPSLQQPWHLHRCSILLGRVDPRKYPHGQQSISWELRKNLDIWGKSQSFQTRPQLGCQYIQIQSNIQVNIIYIYMYYIYVLYIYILHIYIYVLYIYIYYIYIYVINIYM